MKKHGAYLGGMLGRNAGGTAEAMGVAAAGRLPTTAQAAAF